MDARTERVVDKVIKYGSVFAEVGSPKWKPEREIDHFQLNPVAKAVFGLASVTFEVSCLLLAYQEQIGRAHV